MTFRSLFIYYCQRYLVTTWVVCWILSGVLAYPLFFVFPELIRLACATGYTLGSFLGLSLFVPIVRQQQFQAFGIIIATGIGALLLPGGGFLFLALASPDTEPTKTAALFYTTMIPSALIWFCGGAYLALSRWFPEMRDIRLSLRPWRG